MKLDAVKFGFAGAIVTAIAWVLCSLAVAGLPGPMMQMSGHMVHANLHGLNWSMTWVGFFTGLIAWALIAGIFAWALAAIYNRLVG